MTDTSSTRGQQIFAVVTSFLALFAIVGVALYGLPRFYPFFVQELGWSRQQHEKWIGDLAERELFGA